MAAVNWERSGTPGISKRADGSGRVRYRAVVRDSSRRQVARTFGTLAAAKDWVAKTRTNRAEGHWEAPARETLDEHWAYFLETAQLRPSTRELYQLQYRNHIKPALGHVMLNSISKSMVEKWVGDMRKSGKGAATISQVHRQLHRVLQVAVERDKLVKNPAALGRRAVPRARRREPRFLSMGEVGRIAECVEPRYCALVWTLALTGMRIGEASALRVSSVDFSNGAIDVVRNSPEVAGVKYEGETKSERGRRRIPISEGLTLMLREHVSTYGNRFDPESYVFTGPEGGQIRQGNFRKRVYQPAAQAAGILPTPTVHDLRHTAASLYAANGLSIAEAALLMGHATTAMLDRYTHLHWQDDALRAKVAQLAPPTMSQ